MSPMAAVTAVIFGLLIFAPVLAAWSLKRGQLNPRLSRIVVFSARPKAEHRTHHRESDAA
jgi:hypothetical protein